MKEYEAKDIKEIFLERKNGERLDFNEVIISDGDLSGFDLSNSSFTYSQFENVNLRGASFAGSDLTDTLFHDSELQGIDFTKANLEGAVFRFIDLSGANIEGANLHAAVLEDADLDGVKTDEDTKYWRMVCPESGPFIAWKCCTELRVVQLLVPADARRVSATNITCRCDKAKVLSIKSIDESVSYDWAQSTVDPDFYYERGEWVYPANGFEPDRWRDSSRGIHFFMERQQCVDYQSK